MDEPRVVTVSLDLGRLQQQVTAQIEAAALELVALKALPKGARDQIMGELFSELSDFVSFEYVSTARANQIIVRPVILSGFELQSLTLGAVNRDIC